MFKLNKKIYLIVALLVVVCSIVCSSFVVAEAMPVEHPFASHKVMDDLRSTSNWDISNYPANVDSKAQIMNFVEFGYSLADGKDYGLFVYVYNPNEKDIVEMSNLHSVNMNVGNSGYKKFSMVLCNRPDEPSYKNRFYKFYVKDSQSIYQLLNKAEQRTYEVSSVELNYVGDGVVDNAVSSCFTFNGFAKGYGSDKTVDSLVCRSYAIDTIELQTTYSSYRTGISSLGAGHQNQLNTVYFDIPNQYLENYGNLQKIKAEWHEYKTDYMLVLKDQSKVDSIMSYLHQQANADGVVSGCPVSIQSVDFRTVGTGNVTYPYVYKITYNKMAKANPTVTHIGSDNIVSNLHYVFYDNFVDISDCYVSGAEVENFLIDQVGGKSNLLLPDNVSKFFVGSVDSGRTRGYNMKEFDAQDDLLDLNSYDSNHSWWQKLWDYGFSAPVTGEGYQNLLPIYKVTSADVVGTDSDVAKKLLVDEDCARELKNRLANNTSSSTYLFRFANTDYYSIACETTARAEDAVFAQESVFLNFDILSLTFKNNDVYTEIGAVHDPVNLVAGITGPPEETNPIIEWLKKFGAVVGIILIVVLVIALLPVLMPVLQLIVKGIVWLICAPFRLIARIFRGKKE